MSSINSINAQTSFTGLKKGVKKAGKNGSEERKLGGNKSFEEKYSKDGKPVNVTTANLGILSADFILDHLLQIGVATLTFVALALKGKSFMSGVTGGIVDTTKQMASKKNNDKLGITKKFSNYVKSTIDNIKKTKTLRKEDANNLKNNAEGLIKENSKKTVMKGSIIDRLAKKADGDGLFSKFVKKVSKNPNAGSEEVRKFFATRLGITRGADFVDDAAAVVVAGGTSGIAHSVTDIVTDLNDETVAKKAEEANEKYEQAETAAEKKALRKERREERMTKVGEAAKKIADII